MLQKGGGWSCRQNQNGGKSMVWQSAHRRTTRRLIDQGRDRRHTGTGPAGTSWLRRGPNFLPLLGFPDTSRMANIAARFCRAQPFRIPADPAHGPPRRCNLQRFSACAHLVGPQRHTAASKHWLGVLQGFSGCRCHLLGRIRPPPDRTRARPASRIARKWAPAMIPRGRSWSRGDNGAKRGWDCGAKKIIFVAISLDTPMRVLQDKFRVLSAPDPCFWHICRDDSRTAASEGRIFFPRQFSAKIGYADPSTPLFSRPASKGGGAFGRIKTSRG